jgi:hypothetical protein
MRKAFVLAGAFGFASSLLLSPADAGGCGCCGGRSAAATQALSIQWESLPRISPAAPATVTGKSAEEASEPSAVAASTRPYFVYVTDAGADADKVEHVILKDERVALGARAFRAVKMSAEDAAADPLLSKGREIPRFYVVSADAKDVVLLEKGRLSVSAIWDAMRAAAGRTYAQDLESVVKEMRGVVLEFDKIDGERKILEAKKQKLQEKKGSDADMKDVESKLAEVAARQKKAEDRERAIWDLKPRTA